MKSLITLLKYTIKDFDGNDISINNVVKYVGPAGDFPGKLYVVISIRDKSVQLNSSDLDKPVWYDRPQLLKVVQ